MTNLPSDHQAATKWFIGCAKVIMKWSQNDPISNFFDTLQQILEVNSYIYAYHCNVGRDWQSREWGTINRMNKYNGNGRDLIECMIQ